MQTKASLHDNDWRGRITTEEEELAYYNDVGRKQLFAEEVLQDDMPISIISAPL